MRNIYIELTQRFNDGKLRAIISSGQAVVLHRLAIMSKDGDWILREETETMEHVLRILSQYGAQYRLGAPLDVRWLNGGWSSHFEFSHDKLRVRTDFVTRPARISHVELDGLWREQEGKDMPFVDAKRLIEIKKTNREKDYVVIGELARLLPDVKDQLLFSRSARDLMMLAEKHPDILLDMESQRPVLKKISDGRLAIEQALDEERRHLIHTNEVRLQAYMEGVKEWSETWPQIQREVQGHSLFEAHNVITTRACGLLPFSV